MTHTNEKFLPLIADIYNVSAELGTKSYVWGGFAVDILHGSFTREHGDLDCFTENLVENIDTLTARYQSLGYEVNYLPDMWMLIIKKGSALATFNSMHNVAGIAHWYHAGERGTVFFPTEWLDKTPRGFYGVQAYTFGIEMAWTLKNNVRLLSPKWQMREKDRADIAVLDALAAEQGLDTAEILKRVWSHNPYWYEKGYDEYFYPIRL